jgi:hypothetical protein
MSNKNPYPIHYKDLPGAPQGYDENAHGSQGGVANLPNQQTDAEDRPDIDMDGAKTWNPDYSGL